MPKLIINEAKGKTLMLNAHRCQGCELCVVACPTGILELSDELNVRLAYPPRVKDDKGKYCIFCKRCEYACPVWAIYVLEAEPEAAGPGEATAAS